MNEILSAFKTLKSALSDEINFKCRECIEVDILEDIKILEQRYKYEIGEYEQ